MRAAERSEIRWGNTAIAYAIRRSARRGTVSIAVDAEDGVVLTAPAATPVARLDTVVHAKAAWIVQALRSARPFTAPLAVREFVNGETCTYLGRQFRLRLLNGETRPAVALRGRFLEVGVAKDADARAVRRVLVEWYRRHAEVRLTERAAHWARKVGVHIGGVVIREQQKRWGSCDLNGVLRFNWRIIQAAPSLVDYVVAHEVVHLQHDTHGPEFWAALGRVMPDYDRRRDALKAVGRTLEW
ncbi:MAG: M48 family metallopeptidase [Deltaproteobacteria bacterium]|nr:M48 family metallopeptidase [Deltaproteobacteria bacterium]